MDSYLIIITLIGFAALGMAWMPSISKHTRVSYSIIYVLLGMVVYLGLGTLLPLPDPISNNNLTVRLTELVVIISLMGTGLKIDEPFSFRIWNSPLRLVSITMLLSIAITTVIGVYGLGLDLAASVLLGAVLAPTDPVLASDVQVGPPQSNTRDHVKFSLTAEAGLNDGTAFPFTWLAILLATAGSTAQVWEDWLLRDLLYRIAAGLVVGFLMGRLLAYMVFRLPEKAKYIQVRDGFVALSATLLVYGLTELLHGYGFIAVFITAVTLRNYELHHKYHRKLHDFTDQVERILVAIVLVLFGGSLVSGILSSLTWPMVLFGFLFVLLIRPLTSWVGLLGAKLHHKEKLAISFFGIKGMGSFFYLAFALNEVHFVYKEELWSIGAFIVLLSILIHGLTATAVMQKIEMEFAEQVSPEPSEKHDGPPPDPGQKK